VQHGKSPDHQQAVRISQQVKFHTVGDHAPHAEEPLVEAISQRFSDKLCKQPEPGHGPNRTLARAREYPSPLVRWGIVWTMTVDTVSSGIDDSIFDGGAALHSVNGADPDPHRSLRRPSTVVRGVQDALRPA